MPARWNPLREQELIQLVALGKYTNPEIAEIMGLNKNQIATKINHLGLTNSVYRTRITKHAHLREPVMRYFLTHSREQTMSHFGLTQSELKSLFTVGYRDPRFAQLRKETRPHSAWSEEDWLFMLRHSGIMPREWIAKKLNRGNTYNSVKDALAKFKGLGKYMNGMPIGWAQKFLSVDELGLAIKTKAGPTGATHRGPNDFRFKLIPWVTLERLIIYKKVDIEVSLGIQAMAKFQRFIHGTSSEQVIRNRILRVVRSES